MSYPNAAAMQITLAVAGVIMTAYAAGRVHEWYRHVHEREQAFRDGYNQASHSLPLGDTSRTGAGSRILRGVGRHRGRLDVMAISAWQCADADAARRRIVSASVHASAPS